MSLRGITECSVPGCTGSVEGYNSLCDDHRLPGAPVAYGQSTMVDNGGDSEPQSCIRRFCDDSAEQTWREMGRW
jgi:hypothetical protein